MDFTYEKLIAGNTSADSDSGSEVARKFNDNFEAVGNALGSLSEEIENIPDGKDGVGIQSVEQTTTSTEDGGTNIVTVTKTDGTSSTFEVHNGSRGSAGPAGADGKDGAKGPAGADGYTPVRGTDYWTADDIAAIQSYVDEAILGGAW